MNFDFSDEQKELQSHVNKYLTDQCAAEDLLKASEGDLSIRKRLWQGLAEQGFIGAAAPEEFGGVGFGYLELCLIAQELGRVAAPVPFFSSVYLAIEALLQSSDNAIKEQWITKICAGEAIASFALWEPTLHDDFTGGEVKAENGKLFGTKTPVADADIADVAIVIANDESGDCSAYLVDLSLTEVEHEALKVVDDLWPQEALTFNGASATKLEGFSIEQLHKVLDRAAILTAFEQIGGAERSLQDAKEYSLERHAFGRAIGSYQAMKHKMVDMYVAIQLATSHAYYGAWALANEVDDELPKAAAAARVSATKAYECASKEAVQIFGGIGATWECSRHFYYKRSRMLALGLGSERRWKKRLVANIQ